MRNSVLPEKLFLRICVCFILLTLSACDLFQADTQQFVLHGQTMGTRYTIKAQYASLQLTQDTLTKEIHSTLDLANDILSNWIDSSEISRFNHSDSTEWQAISPYFYDVMREASDINVLSQGRFDVTLAPLINLWGFGPDDDAELPTQSEIDAALNLVGQSALLEIRGNPPAMRKLKMGVSINLSAIAKGYAVDMLAMKFQEHGIEHYLIEIGGDLFASGMNAQKQPWRAGIERPDGKGVSIQQIVSLRNMGMATSGDYRKYIDEDGIRLSHIIDPLTGRPVTHTLASVTVIAPSAMQADGLATALMVLGETQGLLLAEKLSIAAYFIVRSGEHFESLSSSIFEKYIASKADE